MYRRIREKYVELAQSDADRRDRLLREGNDPDNFDLETFLDLYKSFLENKTIGGEKNRKELEYHFDGFRRKIQMKLNTLKQEIFVTSEI